MRLLDICTRSVATCDRAMSAPERARLMRERHVGDVVELSALARIAPRQADREQVRLEG